MKCASWDDAQEFCKKASEKTGLAIRLPTEAEWGHACRAGTKATCYTGDGEADLDRAVWHGNNSNDTTHRVGQKTPNTWGLYDMHGNVWEWCADWYGGVALLGGLHWHSSEWALAVAKAKRRGLQDCSTRRDEQGRGPALETGGRAATGLDGDNTPTPELR